MKHWVLAVGVVLLGGAGFIGLLSFAPALVLGVALVVAVSASVIAVKLALDENF